MTKLKLLLSLHDKLSDLPPDEVEERLNFYSEAIEDRMEEGLSEEDAVAAIGTADEIAVQIREEIKASQNSARSTESKPKQKRRLRAWEAVLLALGSPIWLSLLLAACSIVISLYASLWAVVISLWAAFASLAACSLYVVFGIIQICLGNALVGTAVIGASLVLSGLAVFLFFGCRAATDATVRLTKKLPLQIRRYFVRKEAAQ